MAEDMELVDETRTADRRQQPSTSRTSTPDDREHSYLIEFGAYERDRLEVEYYEALCTWERAGTPYQHHYEQRQQHHQRQRQQQQQQQQQHLAVPHAPPPLVLGRATSAGASFTPVTPQTTLVRSHAVKRHADFAPWLIAQSQSDPKRVRIDGSAPPLAERGLSTHDLQLFQRSNEQSRFDEHMAL